jgi:hypothetical protein
LGGMNPPIKMNMPPRLHDGKHDYVLIRHGNTEIGNDPNLVAIYEREPADPINLFVPDTEFKNGRTKVPMMLPIARDSIKAE